VKPDDLSFALRYYRGECLIELLQTSTVFSGGRLVLALGTPRGGKPGLGDNVYAAEKLLRAAEAAGLITRGKTELIREFQVFGVAGRLPSNFDDDPAQRSLVEFCWMVNFPVPDFTRVLELLAR
jgi:hypothetical protein